MYKFRLPASLRLLCLSLLTIQGGCVTANFSKPIASFQQSVNTSTVAIGKYFSNLNNFERQYYLETLAYNGHAVEDIDKNGKPTPLLHATFSPEALKARMNSLALIGIYAHRLTEAAGSKSGTALQTNTKALGDQLNTLQDTFSALASGGDPTAKNYEGPISALIGSIGKMYINSERDAAIREAIDKGGPAVDTILNLLQIDFQTVVKPLTQTSLGIELSDMVQYYNMNRKHQNFSQRMAALQLIEKKADAYQAAVMGQPTALIRAIRTANHALLKYAQQPNTPHSFSQFVSAMSTLQQQVNEISSEIKQIP